MLAHVGHAVNDFSLDQDFQLRIEPWGNSPEKRPEAFRVFLQLTDLVLVWYDVLVKDIYVWIVCATNRRCFVYRHGRILLLGLPPTLLSLLIRFEIAITRLKLVSHPHLLR